MLAALFAYTDLEFANLMGRDSREVGKAEYRFKQKWLQAKEADRRTREIRNTNVDQNQFMWHPFNGARANVSTFYS